MSLYDILGVSKNASPKEIRKAYLNLSKTLHPDKGGDEEDFKSLGEAYRILSDVGLRKSYDSGTSIEKLQKELNGLMNRVFSIFEEAINSRGFFPDCVDLFKVMKELCNEKYLRMDKDISTVKIEIENINSIQKRLKNAEVFKRYLDGNKETLESRIVKINKEKKYIGEVLSYIENCEYEVDEDDDFDIPERRLFNE